MIQCILTIDYEIFGNGTGSLRELVHRPAEQLKRLLEEWKAPLVVFAEAAEFEMIERQRSDDAVEDVKRQLREFHDSGHEIALHLHPQWYNARFERGSWQLDYSEYNLCTLPRSRIESFVDRSLSYLRGVLGDGTFTPTSFRAGNWLFQPTRTAASVLAEKGIQIDSSVFKGGRQREHGLDYRPSVRNSFYWRISDDANVADPAGILLEVPTYTERVPFWRMATGKRLGLQRQATSARRSPRQRFHRCLDILRPFYPLKLDFCRMTLSELTGMVRRVMDLDAQSRGSLKPLVAIGHTKDLYDLDTIRGFLRFLHENEVEICRLDGLVNLVDDISPPIRS